MRILDIDLDFFLHGVVFNRGRDDDRASLEECSPWALDDVLGLLEARCHLKSPLPGKAIEHHGELFAIWRDLIERGALEVPFHVTHVDAHGDLGWGDASSSYIASELLFEIPEARRHPKENGLTGLADGDYLAFAIANQWISELVYVFCSGGGKDIPKAHLKDFDFGAAFIEMKAMYPEEYMRLIHGRDPEVVHREPLVPISQVPYASYATDEHFDMIFFARSPNYTPKESDALYDEIRRRYLGETALG